MLIGSTPTFTLSFPATVDFSQVDTFVFTLSQKEENVSVEKTGAAVSVGGDNHSVTVSLTQQDTLQFVYHDQSDKKTYAEMQLNWAYSNGSRGGSKIKLVELEKNLHMAVIS